MNEEQLYAIAKECGFSHMKMMDPNTIVLREDVRAMCASGNCRRYGKCWSCPPACGSLELCREKVMGFATGLLVQTVGELEDEFDGEGMMEAERIHKARFEQMYEKLRISFPNMLALGAGSCTRCKKCTYPDEPCRFPERMTSSMEAFGMLVQEVCRANDLKYYYGKNTIAYTGCFLLK